MVMGHLQASRWGPPVFTRCRTRLGRLRLPSAHRFLNNPRISLPALAEPLIEAGRAEAAIKQDRYLLVVLRLVPIDVPQARFQERSCCFEQHAGAGRLRIAQSAILVIVLGWLCFGSGRVEFAGGRLAPLFALRESAAAGIAARRTGPDDELSRTATAFRPLVHLIDAEVDSVGHFRQKSRRPARYFLGSSRRPLGRKRRSRATVFGNSRRTARASCISTGPPRDPASRQRRAYQWVAETLVRLLRAVQRNRPKGRRPTARRRSAARFAVDRSRGSRCIRSRIGGVVFADQRAGGLAAATIAFVVLLVLVDRVVFQTTQIGRNASRSVATRDRGRNCKTAFGGQHRVRHRLAVATPSSHPQAEAARHLLVRLSGRQMKHGRLFTVPALLAGLWALLEMLEALNEYTLQDLRTLTDVVLAHLPPQSP